MYSNERSFEIMEFDLWLNYGVPNEKYDRSLQDFCDCFCRCEDDGTADEEHPENVHCMECGKVMAKIVYAIPDRFKET